MKKRRRSEEDTVVVGILGGICSGKSAVAAMFERLGANLILADDIGHKLLLTQDIKDAIAARWGEAVLAPDGRVDRRKLSDIVFAERRELSALNEILHPPIIAEIRRQLEALREGEKGGVVVLDAPLLMEAGLEDLCDRLVFVRAGEAVRQERARASKGWTKEELLRRERFQKPLAEKRQRCHFLVANDGSEEETLKQVQRIYSLLLHNQMVA